MAGIDLGIALGAAANAGLGTYERIQKMRNDEIVNQQRKQQLEMGDMQLQDEREKRAALQTINDITKEFQYGGRVDTMNAGDPTPGIDQSTARSAEPDLSYLSDPVRFQQYQQKIAPFVTRALGPEKGMAFLKDAQTAVQNFVPQAAMHLVAGDTVGATKLLQNSPLFGKDLQAIVPVPDAQGNIIGYHAQFGSKGTLPLDVKQLARATLAPGEFLKDALGNRQAATSERTAAVAERNAAVNEREAAVKEGQRVDDAEVKKAQAEHYRATGRAAEKTADSNEKYRASLAGLADAKAAGTNTNWGPINTEIAREAEKTDYVKRPDPNGDKSKTVVDYGRLKRLRTAARTLAERDPEMRNAPAMAVQAATEELDRIERQVSQTVEAEAADKKAGEPGLFDSGKPADYWKRLGAKNLDDWKKNRAQELADQAMKNIGLGGKTAADAMARAPTAKSGAAVSGTIKGAATPASGNVAKPTTKAEYDALPPNTPYLDPGDNKVKFKKGA